MALGLHGRVSIGDGAETCSGGHDCPRVVNCKDCSHRSETHRVLHVSGNGKCEEDLADATRLLELGEPRAPAI
jgi:hypothetical protein